MMELCRPMATRHIPSPLPHGLQGLVVLLAVTLIVGCDSGSSSEPIVLNDPLNPTETTFEFEYSADDVSNGVLEVTSTARDQLSSVISAYGYSRSDVVSATVEVVTMERISIGQPAVRPKVFDYLATADFYFGTSTSAPLIGALDPVPPNAEVDMNLGPGTNVTSQVQGGATNALLVLDLGEGGQVSSGGDRVGVTVEFRIEVQP